MIFILDRHEKVQAIFNNNGSPDSCPYYDDVMKEDISTGVSTYEFKIPSNHEKADLVQEGGYVVRKDLDGNLRMFTIMQVEETHAEQSEKYIYAEDAGLELLNDIVRPNHFESVNINQALDIVLQDTRWKRGETEYLGVKNIEFQDYQNVVSALQYLVTTFGGELSFRVEMKNGEIVGRYVDFVKQRGNDTKKRFVYNKDIENIKRTVDMTDLVTALIGVGSGDENGNYLTFKDIGYYKSNGDPFDKPYNRDWVGDPEALQRYGVQGKHLFGVFQYETTNPEDLLKATWDELQKRKDPKITYELDVALLERLAGLEHEKVRIGDTVYVIDETFSPPLYLEARVMQLETSFSDPTKDKCTLGNFKAVQSNITEQMRALQSKLLKKETTWDEAKNKAEEAFAAASEAKSTAETANQTATSAQQTALNAQQTASTAEQTANNASQVASNAEQTAEAAQQTAQQAEQMANEAESAAAQAQQTATIALQTADGKNTNYYGPMEPVNPKSGDAWFVTDSSTGKVIAIRHWNGTEWVDDIDNEAINTAISQAQQDATAAIQQAQDAVNRADQVTQDVQSAINQAQQSLDAAQNALTTAQNALDATNSLVDRISDAEGNISTLTQTAQGLQMNISNLQGDINTLTQTANSLVSQIDAKADQSWVSTQLSQLADDINLRVQKGEIINQINISTEGILIDGRKVHITNETTIDNAVIKDAMIESISASKIIATTLSAISADLGNVTAGILNGVEIHGSSFHSHGEENNPGGYNKISDMYLDDGKLTIAYQDTINPGGEYPIMNWDVELFGYGISFSGSHPEHNVNFGMDERGIWLGHQNSWYWGGFSIGVEYIDPGFVSFCSTNNVPLYIYCAPFVDINMPVLDDPSDIAPFKVNTDNTLDLKNVNSLQTKNSSGILVDQYGNIQAKNTVSSGAYWNIKDYSGKVIVKIPWGSSPSPMTFYPQGSNYSIELMKLGSSNEHVGIRGAGQAIIKFLSSSDTVQIRTTSDQYYGDITASAFNTASLVEYKQDITPWTDSVWDIIKNLQLYQYRLKNEVERGIDKIRYGFVIGEGYKTPDMVMSPDREAVEQYLINSLSIKGIQEAILKIESMMQQINNLSQRVSTVEQKLA